MDGRFFAPCADEELPIGCCHTVAAEGFFFAAAEMEDSALGPGSSPRGGPRSRRRDPPGFRLRFAFPF